jgi:hypothetical protein
MATFQISFLQSNENNQNRTIAQNNYEGQPPSWHKDQTRLVLYKEVPIPVTGGSMSFAGVSTSYLSVANDADFRFGTGDFTIEWFQNQQSGISFPRIFSMGTYPSATIGVSIEGGLFYFWIGGTGNSFGSVSLIGAWNYIAITRSGTSVRVFLNGNQLGSTLTSSYNFNDTTNPLRIGTESTPAANNVFKGTMTNFRWTKGEALYTANFTKPSAPLTAGTNTKLLLLANSSETVTTDSSGLNKTVTNNNVTFSSSTPF